jgi:DNA-binding response OmpR family regulator
MQPHARRVLCVEDDSDTCEMISSLLGLIGCDVVTANTAGEALEFIREGRFDLYLLDNWLPGGSGVEVCRRIRESGDVTPVLFYSGAGSNDDRREALEAGAQAYLVKPNDVGVLVETVRRLLERGSV